MCLSSIMNLRHTTLEDGLFHALADPTRRAVLEQLCAREMSVSELRQRIPVSQPAISQHIRRLAEHELVSERRQGRYTLYRARPEGLAPLLDWLSRYAAFWPERVGRLDALLRSMDDNA